MSDSPAELPPPDSWRENVAAIVMDAAGNVLLGQDADRHAHWHFPQGGVGSGETLEEALARELQEEVGLSPQHYSVVANYGGLRYKYRKGNSKSGRWRGQQQCYFLLRCHGTMPPTDCTRTDEFNTLIWLPWQQLHAELFAPFKRKVVQKVLAHFFPPQAEHDPVVYARRHLTTQRYRCFPEMGIDKDERTLFVGGKEEAAMQLERLALRLRAAQKNLEASGERLVVLVMGTPGSGRRQTLRRLASLLDPLRLHACSEIYALAPPPACFPCPLLEQLPPPGGMSLLLHKTEVRAVPAGWDGLENWLAGQGVRLLKIYLLSDNVPGGDFALQSRTDACTQCGNTTPWYAVPSVRRWYRDLIVTELVAAAMERATLPPPLNP